MDEGGGQSHTMRRSIPGADINNKPVKLPCATAMNTPCQGDANLEMGGEETDLRSLPDNGELQQHGVSKKAERIHIASKE